MIRKRLTQSLLFLGAFTVLVVGALSVYLHQQLTQVPNNLRLIPLNDNTFKRHQLLKEEALVSVQRLSANLRQQDGSVVARLSAEELNAFFAYSLAWKLEGQGVDQVLKSTRVEIKDQTLKTTTLLDLSQLSMEQLQGNTRLTLLRRLLHLPSVNDNPIAVTVEGQPTVANRKLVLQNPRVSIGTLQFSRANATQWLGVSPAMFHESLDLEWSNLPIELRRIRIVSESQRTAPLIQLEGQLTAW
ncbi:hypothetical protein [Acaryochloris sp. IP29b_bin.148]|uniref:hypothetical protein n=1 Tax=Acaryochloris sp. IP29b_bin.148 TaxID=2969218 RepID=UPI0026016D2A|nr:hypothetical protein [Acaryochloris sp. IP29b_bin.148]